MQFDRLMKLGLAGLYADKTKNVYDFLAENIHINRSVIKVALYHCAYDSNYTDSDVIVLNKIEAYLNKET